MPTPTPRTLDDVVADPRVAVRTAGPPDPEGRCVVYWMQRAQRVDDNPALDVAIDTANLLGLPVVTFLAPVPFYPHGNLRHYRFLFDGFDGLEDRLRRRRVGLVFRQPPGHRVDQFAAEAGAAVVVGDENPLREPARWRAVVGARLAVPLWTVDADVVVPSRLLEKEQFGARTIRPRIHRLLPTFLERPRRPTARVPWKRPTRLRTLRVPARVPRSFPVDRDVSPVSDWTGGEPAARRALRRFVRERLDGYDEARNRPETEGTSRLSPYLHFGHLGPRTVARAIQVAAAPEADKQAFLEQLIVRRELSINYVRFNPRYDQLDGCEPWARRTLDEHRADARRPRYGPERLEAGATHDPLWNAAQRQMTGSGWMHGYVRMYWAKKILEWTDSPEEAMEVAVRLNDRYELDGRDPNGYTGIAWALGGKHDRAWGPERPVFGKIRFMSFESTRRKFDSRAYIARWAPEGGA